MILICLSAIGLLLAAYAYHVDQRLASDEFFSPYCLSFGECTVVFTSSYSHPLSHWGILSKESTFDISLPVMGMLNYFVYSLLSLFHSLDASTDYLFLGLSSASVIFSLYLLIVLHFFLKEFCIICTSFHITNLSIFVLVALPTFRETYFNQKVQVKHD
jgi:uncharacterized membrane protein